MVNSFRTTSLFRLLVILNASSLIDNVDLFHLQPFHHLCAYMLTMYSGLTLTTVTPSLAPITLVYIYISIHLLSVLFHQSISSTPPDDPTVIHPSSVYLIHLICNRPWATVSIRPICPSFFRLSLLNMILRIDQGLHHHRLPFSLLWIGFSSISCIRLSSLYHLHAKHSLPCKLHDCLGIYIYNPF